MKKIIKKSYFKLSSGVLLYGNYARNLMIAEGFKEDFLHVVYNSLAYSRQLAMRSKLKKSDINAKHFTKDLPVIIFIGRITAQKKIEYTFFALQSLLQKGLPGFNIMLIGDGTIKSELEGILQSLGLESYCHFMGSIYDEEIISNHLFNADLCVSPGEVGLTAIHSLGYGTPVITHDNFPTQMPEFEAIEEDETGMFFEKDHVESLALAIQNWLERYPEKSALIVEKCFQVIDEKFNPNIQLNVIKSALYPKPKGKSVL